MSLRRRLALLAASAVAVAVVLAAVGAYIAVREELRGQVDDSLRAGVERFASMPHVVGALPAGDELPFVQRLEAGAPPPIGGNAIESVQLISPHGDVVTFPREGADQPVSSADRAIAATGSGQSLSDEEMAGGHYRVLTAAVGEAGAVQLTASLEGVDDVLANLRVILFLLCLGGIAVAALTARALAKRVVGPITELTEAAEHISATDDLTRRIAVDGDEEVSRLATRFNAMLDGIQRSQEALTRSLTAQTQLVVDASHELRTPIASLRTDVESLIAHPELVADERERRLVEVEARTEELTALVNDVIELARGDQPDGDVEDVRLDELAAESVAWLQRHAPDRDVVLETEPTVVEGRPDRIARAINNLLDNANKYSPPGEPIEVSVAAGEVTVRDRGPGVGGEDAEQLLDRFRRGGSVRDVPGSGLGLAIVKQVAEAGGGAVSLEPAEGGGTMARLRLAAEQASEAELAPR